jgi:3-hydroxyisobutyrate dehydrogenase-like beta-hydroxyacid dehydrogenase
MSDVIAVLAPGAMGSAVGRRLHEHGATVLTALAGRSAATRGRALAAGMVDADDDRIALADIILSILPPAKAEALAERLAPALCRGGKRTIYVDCNAVNVGTVQRVAGIIAATPARFVDGAIIGAPPKPGSPGPTFYLAGAPAADLGCLQALGLQTRTLDGAIGAASALKMAYAGITKGLTALGAAMVLAASRAGCAEALHRELAASQPQLLKRFQSALPDMAPKADRWVAEMREIAGFAGEDPAAARIYQGVADLYQRLGADQRGERLEFGLIDAFLDLDSAGGGVPVQPDGGSGSRK